MNITKSVVLPPICGPQLMPEISNGAGALQEPRCGRSPRLCRVRLRPRNAVGMGRDFLFPPGPAAAPPVGSPSAKGNSWMVPSSQTTGL